MSAEQVCGGVVHSLPRDLRSALAANGVALVAWNDITPLARNEFICWVWTQGNRRPVSAESGERKKNSKPDSVGRAVGPDVIIEKNGEIGPHHASSPGEP